MAFTVTSQTVNGVSKFMLVGELDASSSGAFKTEIEKVAVQKPKRLVLLVKDLTFMASAGLRVLIFAKQKLGPDVPIHVIAPQEPILDTLEKTGFLQSVYVAPEYVDEA